MPLATAARRWRRWRQNGRASSLPRCASIVCCLRSGRRTEALTTRLKDDSYSLKIPERIDHAIVYIEHLIALRRVQRLRPQEVRQIVRVAPESRTLVESPLVQ